MRNKATIHVPGLKVSVPLATDALPGDLVPMEGPAGGPTLELVLDGSSLTARTSDLTLRRPGGVSLPSGS